MPTSDPVLQQFRLGTPWQAVDPFLFVAYHHDQYPEATADLGPNASLDGRPLGQDFGNPAGWNMYHGHTVPGFPQHPHRGFETVTHVRQGSVDHADSMGATARYGDGDTQWLTTGRGVSHSEMFPLLNQDRPNPLELFQIWLNLPAASKTADPHFSMFWNEQTPRVTRTDEAGRATEVTVIAGRLDGVDPLAPPPESWASEANSDLAIWHLDLAPGARIDLPAASGPDTHRVLYVYEGSSVRIGETRVDTGSGALVDATAPVTLTAGDVGIKILLLQGRPIGEPVAQHGPFVLNDQAGLEQAFDDYRRTRFGGWPWPSDGPVHAADASRFAKHPDGRVDAP
ncbi:pirin family protein [Rhodococcus spelaei]|uniref:Pirin family protein n=1 Tax=Rhodococcus spelaei TaxID=2546320 RepID=A0A541B195_9NOCA|nr:pirin family protein [Rhodococcus spelaei]TQF66096.1 pirin family protein [Rhodococcus spelaei]